MSDDAFQREHKWLESLKPGDEVAVATPSWPTPRYTFETVAKVSPTRRITLSDGVVFKRNGREMGADYTHMRLVEPTPELRAEIEEQATRSAALKTINSFHQRAAPTPLLVAIARLIEGHAAKQVTP